MQEVKQEALEKMFPQGFLILYVTDDGNNVRMLLSAEKETEGAKDLSQAWDNINKGEWRQRK